MTPDIAELARLAEAAARQAGELIVDQRPERPGVAGTKTSPTDVVTAMDQAVEDLLRELARVVGAGLVDDERSRTHGPPPLHQAQQEPVHPNKPALPRRIRHFGQCRVEAFILR
jgi:hypothetical protein